MSDNAHPTISFPTSAYIGDVERALEAYFAGCASEPESLHLDFGLAEFIEVPTLLFLIALIADRTKRGKATTFGVPRSKLVRDFLRVWDFPAAVKATSGVPFSRIVPEEDLSYFGENTDKDATFQYGIWQRYEGSLQRLLSEHFFSIQTYVTELDSRITFAVSESLRWQGDLIKSVLNNYLRGREGYIANHVIFEASTNAERHPGASVIAAASSLYVPKRQVTVVGVIAKINEALGQLIIEDSADRPHLCEYSSRTAFHGRKRSPETAMSLAPGERVQISGTRVRIARGFRIVASDIALAESTSTTRANEEAAGVEEKPDGYLTICFWDDGISMIDTLRAALRGGLEIKALDTPELYSDHLLVLCNYSGEVLESRGINSGEVPTDDSTDEVLLVATTFPGITRDVKGVGRITPPAALEASIPDSPGMGLFVLLNAVVDIFGGSVTFRTKDHLMSIKKDATGASRYRIKVVRYRSSYPSFLGNLVTVRVPVSGIDRNEAT